MKQGCLYQPPLTGENNFFINASGSSFMNHRHMEIELLYCMSGSAKIGLKDDICKLNEGELLFVRPMENHSIDSDEENLLFVVEMGEDLLGKEFKFFHENDFTVRKYTSEGKIKEILDRIYTLYSEKDDEPVTKWKIKAALFELAANLPEFLKEPFKVPVKTEEKSKTKKNMDRLFVYINNNLTNEINLQTAELVAGYERKYLCRIFKESTGLTFHKYINAYRIDRACSLIDDGRSFSEVRAAVGLTDERTFIRVFIACKNMTPTQYKNRHKKQAPKTLPHGSS